MIVAEIDPTSLLRVNRLNKIFVYNVAINDLESTRFVKYVFDSWMDFNESLWE